MEGVPRVPRESSLNDAHVNNLGRQFGYNAVKKTLISKENVGDWIRARMAQGPNPW